MKKFLTLAATLAAFTGGASAQSSVTLFGIVDVGMRAVKNGDGSTVKSLTRDGLNASRLGFRGSEDLGSGARANFWLEGSLSPDTGGIGSTATAPGGTGAVQNGKLFDRVAWVGLSSPWGEVRLGREYAASFTNLMRFDIWTGVGVAGNGNLVGGGFANSVGVLGSGAGTLVRADNSVSYLLPANLGGVYGKVLAAAGEGVNNVNGNNKHFSARIGWAGRGFDMAVAAGRTAVPGNSYFDVWNAGAEYAFANGVRVQGLIHQAAFTPAGLSRRTQRLWGVGAYVPFGQHAVRAIYNASDMRGGNVVGMRDQDDARQFGVGYIYALSKRTALYVEAARLQNRGLSALAIPGGNTIGSNFGVVPDRTSTALALGISHTF